MATEPRQAKLNMILNISGSQQPTKFERVQLDQFTQYRARFISLHANFTSKADAGIYQLSTNIIDREKGNSNRIIAFIRLERKQIHLEFTPTHSIWYKLRFKDISSAHFKLKSIASDEEVFFAEFACQIEICENARI